MKTKEEILRAIRLEEPFKTQNTLPYSKYMYKIGEDDVMVYWPIGDESLQVLVYLNGEEVKK